MYLLFRRDLLLHQPNYIYVQGRRQDFGSGGTSDKISHMNSTQVLYCNSVAKISVGGTFSKNVLIIHQRLLKNFEKFKKIFAQKFKNFPKFFKNKI